MNALSISDTRMPTQRILALWFPYLSTERILRQRLGRSWRSTPAPALAVPPMVVSHREANTQRIKALDERAEALKLKCGMGIADARAMHPGIDIVEADPDADRRLLESLADWCDRYTPLVAIEPPCGLFLDISGCAHLFGGEKALLDDLMARFFHQGFDVRAGLSSTPGAAWAAARFSAGTIVAQGEEEALLAPLPLSALRIDAVVRASLESVGLRTAGALLNAPRAPLARRFGRTLLQRIDQALGRVDEAISPRLPVAPLSVERHLAEPVVLTDEIEALVLLLARTLKTDLERRAEGARMLSLRLFRVDGAVSGMAVATSRPLREPELVTRLFRERLAGLGDALDAGYGFDLVRLSATTTAPFAMTQADLVATQACDEELARFVDRVHARFASPVVVRPLPRQSHVPERAVDLSAIAQTGSGAVEPSGWHTPARPVRLFNRPEPVDVTAEVPEGAPLHFRWRRALHRVLRSEGPERIAPEWWRLEPGDDWASGPRDYFRVEDGDGRRYWLFRQGLYGETQIAPRWFMHGVFA